MRHLVFGILIFVTSIQGAEVKKPDFEQPVIGEAEFKDTQKPKVKFTDVDSGVVVSEPAVKTGEGVTAEATTSKTEEQKPPVMRTDSGANAASAAALEAAKDDPRIETQRWRKPFESKTFESKPWQNEPYKNTPYDPKTAPSK